MATAIIMPKAGMSMETGTVIKWLKKIGDSVQTGEPIVEIETDKVAMEVEAETSGILLAVVHESGDVVPVTLPIGYIGTEAELKAGFVPPREAAGGASASASAEATPAEAATITASQGPAATAGGKIPMTPAARAKIRELGLNAAELRPTGPRGELRLRDVESASSAGIGKTQASPLARKVAQDLGVDLSTVQGSGPGGRVVKRDVEGASVTAAPKAAAPATLAGMAVDTIPLSRTRKVIAERLSKSMFTAPHYYLKAVIPAENLIKSREIAGATAGRKISINALLMKMAAEALKKFPIVNASWQGDSIAQFRSIDIGLAVAQPDGLITPVIRDCGGKGLLQIDEELAELIERAKIGKLLPDEYTNATFSISNLGAFGVEEFTAVINPPGSAILAVGSLKKEPVVDSDGEIVAKTLLRVTLSCDHRVIDGAVGASFLKHLSGLIENPVRALF